MIPDAYYKDIYSIKYNRLKKLGYKYIFLDLDNTMIKYYSNEIPKELYDLIELLKVNFKVFIFSNSRSKRVKNISKELGISAYYFSKKPLKKSYKIIKNIFDYRKCIFIGDQFMTDVLGAKRSNMKVIFVDKLDIKEPITTKFWRFFEKIKLKRLKKKNKFELYSYYDNLI